MNHPSEKSATHLLDEARTYALRERYHERRNDPANADVFAVAARSYVEWAHEAGATPSNVPTVEADHGRVRADGGLRVDDVLAAEHYDGDGPCFDCGDTAGFLVTVNAIDEAGRAYTSDVKGCRRCFNAHAIYPVDNDHVGLEAEDTDARADGGVVVEDVGDEWPDADEAVRLRAADETEDDDRLRADGGGTDHTCTPREEGGIERCILCGRVMDA